MTEAELLDAVREAAMLLGVLTYHTHDSRRSEPGFPDLVLVGHRLEFWELKSEKGRVSADQAEWHRRLREAGAIVAVIRPDDWLHGVVEQRLRVMMRRSG